MSDTSIELKVFESSNGNLPPLTPVQEEILRLKKERKAVLLVHNYQCAEIQRVADFVGDSLGLSYQAEAAKDAEVIVFCGVHFMAETANILSPDKIVLLPDASAGCEMADMMDKIIALRKECEKRGIEMDIQVDGGISLSTVETAAKAGANVLVAGSAIFGSDDPEKTIAELRSKAAKYFD